jgi:hypothetical protein
MSAVLAWEGFEAGIAQKILYDTVRKNVSTQFAYVIILKANSVPFLCNY